MSVAKAETLATSVEAIYNKYQALRVDSPESDFVSFASLFANDCTVYLRSMREHKEPARSRAEIIQHLHDILADQYLQKYRVISQAFNQQDRQVFTEMENGYTIHGKTLPRFRETGIATFDQDGLVASFKLYSCRSDLVFLIQKATGRGPYSQEYLDHETVDCC